MLGISNLHFRMDVVGDTSPSSTPVPGQVRLSLVPSAPPSRTNQSQTIPSTTADDTDCTVTCIKFIVTLLLSVAIILITILFAYKNQSTAPTKPCPDSSSILFKERKCNKGYNTWRERQGLFHTSANISLCAENHPEARALIGTCRTAYSNKKDLNCSTIHTSSIECAAIFPGLFPFQHLEDDHPCVPLYCAIPDNHQNNYKLLPRHVNSASVIVHPPNCPNRPRKLYAIFVQTEEALIGRELRLDCSSRDAINSFRTTIYFNLM